MKGNLEIFLNNKQITCFARPNLGKDETSKSPGISKDSDDYIYSSLA